METKGRGGFTLIELLIAIGLMAFLSFTTTQILKSSTRKTKKITAGIDSLSRIRSVLNIMENDIARAFNYSNLNLFLYNEAQKKRIASYDSRVDEWIKKKNTETKQNPPLTRETLTDALKGELENEIGPRPKPFKPIPEKVYTYFVGDKEKLYFTSSSGVRYRKEDKVSDLAEVGYFFKTCRSLINKNSESKCLWRSISYNLDGNVTEGASKNETVLLENIEDFEFQYLSSIPNEKPDWSDNWDGRSQGDVRTGRKFPEAVSLKIKVRSPSNKKETENKKGKVYEFYGLFPLRFPNNEPLKELQKSLHNVNATGNPKGF